MTRLPLDALISAQGEAAAIAKDCALARALGTINDSPQAAAMAAEAEARARARFSRLAAALGFNVQSLPTCHDCHEPRECQPYKFYDWISSRMLCAKCAEAERQARVPQ